MRRSQRKEPLREEHFRQRVSKCKGPVGKEAGVYVFEIYLFIQLILLQASGHNERVGDEDGDGRVG